MICTTTVAQVTFKMEDLTTIGAQVIFKMEDFTTIGAHVILKWKFLRLFVLKQLGKMEDFEDYWCRNN